MDYDDLYFEKFDRQEMDMIYQALKELKEQIMAAGILKVTPEKLSQAASEFSNSEKYINAMIIDVDVFVVQDNMTVWVHNPV